MITVIGYPDYIDGYIRHAHFELEITDEEQIEEFSNLSTKEKIETLTEYGKLVIDDYRINDYGEITEIEY